MTAGALAGLLVAFALGGCGGSETGAGNPATTGAMATASATSTATTPSTTASTTATTTVPRRQARKAPRAHGHPAPRLHQAPTHATTTPPSPAPRRSTPKPRPTTTTRKPGPLAHPIQETAQLVLIDSPAPGRYEQQGTVTGTFDGTMTLRAHLTDAGVVVDFIATVTGGTATGHGLAIPTITSGSSTARLNGTASITGGTGTFAHVRASKLKVTGTAVLPSGAKATVHLTGTVTY